MPVLTEKYPRTGRVPIQIQCIQYKFHLIDIVRIQRCGSVELIRNSDMVVMKNIQYMGLSIAREIYSVVIALN